VLPVLPYYADFKKYIILLLSEGEIKEQKAMIMTSICYESVKLCLLSVCLHTEYPVSKLSIVTGLLPSSLTVHQMICLQFHHLCVRPVGIVEAGLGLSTQVGGHHKPSFPAVLDSDLQVGYGMTAG